MNVLVLPSWYPREDDPLRGIYFKEQVQALARRGVQIGVVYPEARSLRELSFKRLRAYRFQRRWYDEDAIPTLRLHGWNVLSRLPQRVPIRIRQAVRLTRSYVDEKGKPDLMHAHSARWAAAAAARIAESCEIPYVVTEHFSKLHPHLIRPWQARIAEEGFRSAARVLTVSQAFTDVLHEQQLVDPSKTVVVPNFVDEAFFTLPPSPSSQNPFRFFTLGSLYPWKGYHVLIDAFARAFDGSPEVVLDIGGTGPERRRLERAIRTLGLGDRVTLLGELNRTEVRDALWHAHAFVHPSFFETFGIVLVEAMATGCPVVATASGGPEEIVREHSGILVPSRDVDALTTGLRRLYEEYARFDAAAIRSDVVQRFGKDVVTEQILAVYEEVLSS